MIGAIVTYRFTNERSFKGFIQEIKHSKVRGVYFIVGHIDGLHHEINHVVYPSDILRVDLSIRTRNPYEIYNK